MLASVLKEEKMGILTGQAAQIAFYYVGRQYLHTIHM